MAEMEMCGPQEAAGTAAEADDLAEANHAGPKAAFVVESRKGEAGSHRLH